MPLTQSYPSMFWQQFHDENGNPLANGTVKTFLASDHSMPVQTYTYPGSGVKNPTTITLDDAGKCVMALEIGLAYYIEVYDVNNNLKGTFDNVTAGGGTGDGGGHLTFTSSDGSITITRVGDNVDLSVVKDTDIYGTVEGYGIDSSGIITFSRIVDGDITLDSGNIVVDPYKLYHLTVHLDFSNNSAGDLYKYAKLIDSEAHEHMFTVDQSMGKNYIEVSFDIVPSRGYISLQLENTGSTLSSALVYIHRINPVVGSNAGGGSGVPNEIIYVEDQPSDFYRKFGDWDGFQHAILGEHKCVIVIEWEVGEFNAYYLTRFEDKAHGARAMFSRIPYVKKRGIEGGGGVFNASTNGAQSYIIEGDDNTEFKFRIRYPGSYVQDLYMVNRYDATFISTSPDDFATKVLVNYPWFSRLIPYGAVALTNNRMYRCKLSYAPDYTDTTFDSTHWEETAFDMAIFYICQSITDVDRIRICVPATSFSNISTWLSWHKQCILIDSDGIYEVSSYDANSITFTRCGIGSNGEAVVYKDVLDSSDVHTKSTSSTLPAYSIADAGKTLQVQADGTLAWV